MYNPNEMDNTLNEGLNNPENRNQEADAASTEQVPFESASEEPTSEAVQDASESVQEADHYESQASNEAHAEQTQAPSYTSAYTNPASGYSNYQANYSQQPYNAYHLSLIHI